MYKIASLFFVTISLLSACNKSYTPKPRGFFRIDFPEKKYQSTNHQRPYTFEYPIYSKIIEDPSMDAEPFWINIDFPENNSKIYMSYKRVNNNLFNLTEDSREFAYKHSIKASSINEKIFINQNSDVYGTIYQIKGNAASPFQFHLTDSLNHFIRGSFYISEVPNYDSLKPVIDFIETDIYHIIETFSWN